MFVIEIYASVEKKFFFFTIPDNCDQDVLSALRITKHVLQQFKLDMPSIKKNL